MYRTLAAIWLTVALGACEATEDDERAVSEPRGAAPANSASSPTPVRPIEQGVTPMPRDDDDGGCGADKVDRWLNVLPTDEVKANIAAEVGDRPIRFYTQGDPVTLDFIPSRLNVELGKDGRIKLFRCG